MFWISLFSFLVTAVIAIIVVLSYRSQKKMESFDKLDDLTQQAFISNMKPLNLPTEEYESIADKKVQDSPEQLFSTAMFLFFSGQNYKQSYENFTSLAEQGNVDALYFLGKFYESGFGIVQQDQFKAQNYYLQAAEKGHACGQYAWAKQILIDHLMKGLTEKQMKETKCKAMDFMHNAAEQKNSEACFWLAMQYLQGTYGLSINYPKSHDLLVVIATKKSLLNVPLQPNDLKELLGYFEPQIAQYILGLYHISVLPGAIDYQKAVDYFKQAIDSKYPEAAALYALAKLYDENKLPLTSIQSKSLAFDYYKAACQHLSEQIDQLVAISWYYKPYVSREKAALKVNQLKYDKPTSSDFSFEEIEKLAKLGKAKSQFILGRMYLQGDKIDKNIVKAQEWFEKAALQGHAEAQWQLALLLSNQDNALIWFKKAADQLIVSYMEQSILKNYGFACLEQDFIPQSKTQKKTQKTKAIEYASYKAETLIKHYIKLKNSMDQDDEEVNKQIKACLTELLGESHPEKYFYQAVEYYSNGNYKEALQSLEKAKEQGSKHAYYLLGMMYRNGEGVEVNYDKSQQYYEQGAKLGCCYAQYECGWFGNDNNDYLLSAAKQNHFSAMLNLAKNYQRGENSYPMDYSKAFYWYSILAKATKTALDLFDPVNNDAGFKGLGELYLRGQGCKQDLQTAADLFEQADFHETLYIAANLYYGEFLTTPRSIALEKAGKLYESVCSHLLYIKDLYLTFDFFDESLNEEEAKYKAKLVYYDDGTNPDTTIEELLVLAKKGYHKSQYQVAIRYADPKTSCYDEEQAIYWFTQSAESNNEKSCYELGKYYLTVKKQADKACEFLKPLADKLCLNAVNENKLVESSEFLTIEELKKIPNQL